MITHTERSGRGIDIHIEGLESLYETLGDLKGKAPAAAKVAINATAREARKVMIAAAKAKYAVNAAGLRHIKKLKQKKRASNTSLWATLQIATMRDDLGYFQNNPREVFSGHAVFTSAPAVVRARVLKASPLKSLSGVNGKYSKGFLAKFKSGHIGMVQRVIGSDSGRADTEKHRPRWRNSEGKVEKLRTMGAASASAMHGKIWDDVQAEVEAYFITRLDEQVSRVIERAKLKGQL